MQCVIPGSNIKVLGRAVHALARIGDELYVDPDPDVVSLRTVNSSRSAYASVALQRPFFAQYAAGAAAGQEAVKCKVALKACLSAFRSLASLEKTVERCKITLEENNSRMVVFMECKHNINKTYHIAFIECETLQAVYSPGDAANRLSAAPRLLQDAAAHFRTGQEEVTLSVTPRQLTIRNYTDDEPDPAKAIRTVLALSPAEFDGYTIGADCEVTFCLRELRAVLLFTEPLAVPLALSFDGPGRPIVFCASVPHSVEAHFVLATLAERGDTQAGSQSAAAQRAHTSARGDRLSTGSAYNGTANSTARFDASARPVSPGPPADPGLPACASTPLEEGPDAAPPPTDGLDAAPPADGPDGLADAAPVTPPRKRARFTFQRCFNETIDPLRVPGHGRVLAPDSDEE
ncbi:LOW QUALITY PROTEIN: cell cycle checkpoint control protein RAD9A-like [Pollicipes pollicipes]|uniref:LOW QUALITY PROTEIN: cell cycle checkpoint control protein RAD9A-like n=1 Tax=Pollicipes pollicipes TaxID=41117 RepID=UPI0018854A73|nr:LOW QUALITY PROTEIN: cell cycle checkpoint control protein RAD9A-like [Pollicipes pollicipes]